MVHYLACSGTLLPVFNLEGDSGSNKCIYWGKGVNSISVPGDVYFYASPEKCRISVFSLKWESDILEMLSDMSKRRKRKIDGKNAHRLYGNIKFPDHSSEYTVVPHSAYRTTLSVIKWNNYDERYPFELTSEIGVCSSCIHIFVYYQIFSGYIIAFRSPQTIPDDLAGSRFIKAKFAGDCGCDSIDIFEPFIRPGRMMVSGLRTSQKMMFEISTTFGKFDCICEEMELTPNEDTFRRQYDSYYGVAGFRRQYENSASFRCYLYFDSTRRSTKKIIVDIQVRSQRQVLADMPEEEIVQSAEHFSKTCYNYFKISSVNAMRILPGFKTARCNRNNLRKLSDFYSLASIESDSTPMDILPHERLRNEQQNYFEQMVEQMLPDYQRNCPADGKPVRLSINYLSRSLFHPIRAMYDRLLIRGNNIFFLPGRNRQNTLDLPYRTRLSQNVDQTICGYITRHLSYVHL